MSTDMSTEAAAPVVRVYEPALCCNTGVCGPELDQSLVDFTADLNHVATLGADISRHNLANDPTAFASDDTVRAFLQVAGSDGLPLTTVDGITVMTGTYPTRAQLVKFAGLVAETPVIPADLVPAGSTLLDMTDADADASTCGPTGCC